MAGIVVVAEVGLDGALAHISSEVATLARRLGEESGVDVEGLVVAPDPGPAAGELARYLPSVNAVSAPDVADHMAPQRVAEGARLVGQAVDYVLLGATPDGRDTAGILAALLGWPILTNATGVAWEDGPVVEMSIFGGKLITRSTFTDGHGVITIRPNVVAAEPSGAAGKVSEMAGGSVPEIPGVRIVERVSEQAASVPIEEARVVVAGGRGVGGEEGFKVVEELADALGGAVGATRAAVDAGWIPYGQQIGQTGKIVKPQLYLALGISGAIQHKVGMQTAETIVAVNRDPDAPIAEFADLLVIGDLFEVAPAIAAALRERKG